MCNLDDKIELIKIHKLIVGVSTNKFVINKVYVVTQFFFGLKIFKPV